MWKLKNYANGQNPLNCFSPLAGIRYVETWKSSNKDDAAQQKVSVPLRGLDMWKQIPCLSPKIYHSNVSVPLRGLDMWKQK